MELLPIGGTLNPNSPTLHLSTNGGKFVPSPLALIDVNLYEATIPAGDCSGSIPLRFS